MMQCQQSGDAVAPACRGFAADAGIDDLTGNFFLLQAGFHQRHPAFAALQAVFGAQ